MAHLKAAPASTVERSVWLSAMLIVGAGIACYHNSFAGAFVFDDLSAIAGNPTIRRLWPLWEAMSPPVGGSLTVEGRPVLNLSFAINHALGGLDVRGYHVANLLIHLLGGLLLFGIVRRSLALPSLFVRFGGAATMLAFMVALVWTVHPLQTESVTYVVQRAESLMGLFYLLTLYCFIRGCTGAGGSSRAWHAAGIASCFLGMGAKEVMVSAPLAVLLYDRAFLAGSIREAWRLRWGVHAGLAASWTWLAWLVVSGGGNRSGIIGFGVGVSWWEYWFTQVVAITHYLRLSLWPHPLVFEYGVFWVGSPLQILPSALFLGALIAGTVAALVFRPKTGFVGFWFFALLAPTSLLPSTTQMIVEHRMYLALAAVVVALVIGMHQGVQQLRTSRKRPVGDSVPNLATRTSLAVWPVVGLVFAVMTMVRNEDYRSELTLWQDTVAKRPQNFLAHHMLASALERSGSANAALKHYRESIRIEPRFHRAHSALGRLLLELEQVKDAETHLRTALALRPDYGEAHVSLGVLLAKAGRFADAILHFEAALEEDAMSVVTRYNYGHALFEAGRRDEAIAQYQAVLAVQPEWWEGRYNLANALAAMERGAEAVEQYEAMLRLRPAHAPARNNLANLLMRQGRPEEAIGHYRAALQVDPGRPDTHHNLGNALFELGRLEDAAEHYEAALKLNPNLSATKNSLGHLRKIQQAGGGVR